MADTIKDKFSLAGRTALVTGSSRGIGKAIGDAFEEFGAKVIRHDSKVCDLSDPVAIDALNLAPDILSILVGVNDSYHEASGNGVEPERAERIYRELLAWTKQALPSVRLVILEPFTFPFGMAEKYAAEVAVRAAYTRRLAEEFGATFIPLQSIFNEVCRTSKPQHWSPDGAHLTPAGHQLVADAWLAAVKI